MASSFISFKEKGFWIPDTLFECVTGVMYVTIKQRLKEEVWINEFGGLLKANTLGYYPSYMHLDLDSFIVDEERRSFFISLINQTAETISNSGVELNLDFLEEVLFPEKHCVENNWGFKVKAARLLKILYYLELMMFEKLEIKVSDKIFYKF